ncbi:MAG: hypothetical protein ABEK03_08115 [Candidatus Bipolaricaulia bacterium]
MGQWTLDRDHEEGTPHRRQREIATLNARIRDEFDRRFDRPIEGVLPDDDAPATKASYFYDAMRDLSVALGYVILREDVGWDTLQAELGPLSMMRIRRAIAAIEADLRRSKLADRPKQLSTADVIGYLSSRVPF